jgi:prepilin-type N-terminal cleavage/methylation domain-containing protein
MYQPRKAFTLIELLVVIAIIAILAVVVVLTLNPAEMLRQARDANRLSDLATINSAVNFYATDQSGSSGFSLGNASSVYVSLPDTSSTCANLGLPTTTPSGINYACVVATSSRNINSTGWLPVNLSLISSGSPLGALPVDPTNQSSSGLYYTYYGNGTQFEATALFESAKNKAQYGQKPIALGLPEVDAVGSSLTINPLFNPTGLVGYWPMDEGSGSSTQDVSGNNNIGTWSGNASGTNSTYYAQGKVGSYAGNFDGSTDKLNVSNSSSTYSSILSAGSAFTIMAWINSTCVASPSSIFDKFLSDGVRFMLLGGGSCNLYIQTRLPLTSNAGPLVPMSTWSQVGVTMTSAGTVTFYVNGVGTSGGTNGTAFTSAAALPYIGYSSNNGTYFSGLIDDVRIYNRALSAAEIQALYNAER